MDNEIVIDYLKFMKMQNHANFNFLFASEKLNHSFSEKSLCFFVCAVVCLIVQRAKVSFDTILLQFHAIV